MGSKEFELRADLLIFCLGPLMRARQHQICR